MILYGIKNLVYEGTTFKQVSFRRVLTVPMGAYSRHSTSSKAIFTDTDYFDFPPVNMTLAIEKSYYSRRHWFK